MWLKCSSMHNFNLNMESFEHSVSHPIRHHHFLVEINTRKEVCSISNKHQDLSINKNDTLCQSYSPLSYNKEINTDRKERQIDMIKLYRRIVKNKKFRAIFNTEVLKIEDNKTLWRRLYR